MKRAFKEFLRFESYFFYFDFDSPFGFSCLSSSAKTNHHEITENHNHQILD